MELLIRQAGAEDLEAVSSVLQEAAVWLEQQGMTLWRASELALEQIQAEVSAGLFQVAETGQQLAGVIKFQLEDPLFWPDALPGEAAYIHRLAVRRQFAGGAVSAALLNWALERTRSLGRKFLRMDTEASRARLRAIYEAYGFQYHSDSQVGPYHVARYQYPINRDII